MRWDDVLYWLSMVAYVVVVFGGILWWMVSLLT